MGGDHTFPPVFHLEKGATVNPEDMCRESPATEEWSDDEIKAMWSQAEGELNGFANALKAKSGITASQLRMALQMARREFKRLTEPVK